MDQNSNMETIHNNIHSNITLGLHFTIRQMTSLSVMCFFVISSSEKSQFSPLISLHALGGPAL